MPNTCDFMFRLLNGLRDYTSRLTSARLTAADQHFRFSHWYDEDIENLIAQSQLRCPPSMASFNQPDGAHNAGVFEKNYRALARRMLQHLDDIKLINKFRDLPHVTIVSLGCGFGFDVIPLLIYFAYHEKSCHYVGFDIDPKAIAECQNAFRPLKNVRFVEQDARDATALKGHLGKKADCVVVQHPNLLLEPFSSIHSTIITQTIPAIASNNASVYIALYYQAEMELFHSKLKPSLEKYFGPLQEEVEKLDKAALFDRNTQLAYTPERYIIHN